MNRLSRWMPVWAGVGWAFIAVTSASSAEVEPGASREDVIDKLGEPDGMMARGDQEVLYYVRGQVDLQDDEVTRSSVLSEAEYKAEQERLAQQAAARRKAAEEAAARRREAGQKKLQAIRDGDTLAGKSAAERLAYWKAFTRQYPGVDVGAEIRDAEAQVSAQKEAKAAFESKVQEQMKKAPKGLSRSKLRRYRRGRSESALAAREAEIRAQLEQEMAGRP